MSSREDLPARSVPRARRERSDWPVSAAARTRSISASRASVSKRSGRDQNPLSCIAAARRSLSCSHSADCIVASTPSLSVASAASSASLPLGASIIDVSAGNSPSSAA